MKYAHFIKPMLAKISDEPFDSDDWIFEIKFDGYRAVAELDKRKVKLYSRNGLDFSKDYPLVYEALRKLKLRAVFDGEIVALDKKDRPSFQLLQQIADDSSIPLVYYVFDLLEWEGKDVRHLPLLERKEILEKNLKSNDVIRYSDHVMKEGKKFFKLVVKKDLEGMMAKKSDSSYNEGRRSGDWLKIKHHHEQEAIIVGFTEPKGGRKHFGSLLLAVNEKGKLIYTGHAGTGFDEKMLQQLFMKMKPLITNKSPFKEKISANGPVTWISPVLVSNIKFSEWTQDGQMRHPVFLGLRKDKSANEVIKEKS